MENTGTKKREETEGLAKCRRRTHRQKRERVNRRRHRRTQNTQTQMHLSDRQEQSQLQRVFSCSHAFPECQFQGERQGNPLGSQMRRFRTSRQFYKLLTNSCRRNV
jgi:hypothetical protein